MIDAKRLLNERIGSGVPGGLAGGLVGGTLAGLLRGKTGKKAREAGWLGREDWRGDAGRWDGLYPAGV